LKQRVGEQRRALTVGSLRTKDKGRVGSIGGRVLLMNLIRRTKMKVEEGNTYRFLSIDKRTKSKGRRAIVHAPIVLWHRRRLHKDRIFDECSERRRF
jgi:hypothetical protein